MMLVSDIIKDDKTFLLYAKTFIPQIYNYAVEHTSIYEWANFAGNDVINCIMRILYSNNVTTPISPILSNHGYQVIMHFVIMNRHLQDYWLQSYLLKKL